MAMRMVTIFVALIVCGMFFPDLARGEDLSSDQGLQVNFEDVVVGGERTIPLTITNQSESTFTLILLLNMDAACEFTYTGPNVVSDFEPGNTLNVQVKFTPSAVGVCNAVLQIQYFGSGGVVEINFTANGVEEPPETPKKEEIFIGQFPTGVTDREIEIDEHNTSNLGDMIGECEDTFYNRGYLVRCVAWLTGELSREGSITYQDKRKLRRAAAKAEIYKIMQEMKTSKKSRRSRFWWLH